MNWHMLLIILVLNLRFSDANHNVIDRIIKQILRRYAGHRTILKSPRHLPRAERGLPGHTLIRPALQMLKSSVKYPSRDRDNMAVYGNIENLGISYGKEPYRVMYSGFRRTNDIVQSTIIQAIRNIIDSNPDKSDTNVIFIEALNSGEVSSLGTLRPGLEVIDHPFQNDENDAREVMTDSSFEIEESQARRFHHKGQKKKSKKDILKNSETSESSDESASSTSSDFEINHGNPFTTYKGKYKQNWMWNHFMDGDHMNVNPFAPALTKLGPHGFDLFFGRKWWYFNQDDFLPLR